MLTWILKRWLYLNVFSIALVGSAMFVGSMLPDATPKALMTSYCPQRCWLGIIPGETLMQNGRLALEMAFPAPRYKVWDDHYGTKVFFVSGQHADPNWQLCTGIAGENEIVTAIAFNPSFCEPPEVLTLGQILYLFGPPSCVIEYEGD